MGKGAVMPKTYHKTAFAEIPLDYAALVAMFPPCPIHDSVDYANTMEVVMAMAGHKLTRDQDDYLTILSEMILHYDREHDQPRQRGLPHERLQYLVKEAGLSALDFGRLLGNRGMGSVFLTGKRGLSKANIRKLAEHFKVQADYPAAGQSPTRSARLPLPDIADAHAAIHAGGVDHARDHNGESFPTGS